MTTSHPLESVRISRIFSQTARQVFRAWTDPRLAAGFIFATPSGKIIRSEIELKVGGKYTFVDRRDKVDVEHTGEYLEIKPPHRLVFTLSVPHYSQDTDRITVEIESLGEGCEVSLTHRFNPAWVEFKDRIEEGWAAVLENLARVLRSQA